MSIEALDALVGRAIRDQEFRELLLADPDRATAEYDIGEDALDALRAIDREASRQFFALVDQMPLRCWCTEKKCYSGIDRRPVISWELAGELTRSAIRKYGVK